MEKAPPTFNKKKALVTSRGLLHDCTTSNIAKVRFQLYSPPPANPPVTAAAAAHFM